MKIKNNLTQAQKVWLEPTDCGEVMLAYAVMCREAPEFAKTLRKLNLDGGHMRYHLHRGNGPGSSKGE